MRITFSFGARETSLSLGFERYPPCQFIGAEEKFLRPLLSQPAITRVPVQNMLAATVGDFDYWKMCG
jgi:hypothetical protein